MKMKMKENQDQLPKSLMRFDSARISDRELNDPQRNVALNRPRYSNL